MTAKAIETCSGIIHDDNKTSFEDLVSHKANDSVLFTFEPEEWLTNLTQEQRSCCDLEIKEALAVGRAMAPLLLKSLMCQRRAADLDKEARRRCS